MKNAVRKAVPQNAASVPHMATSNTLLLENADAKIIRMKKVRPEGPRLIKYPFSVFCEVFSTLSAAFTITDALK